MKKVVVVTGCNGGIGSASCTKFKSEGWMVIGIDVRKVENQAGLDRFIQADIVDVDQINTLAQSIQKQEGRVDAIVNNAALQVCKPFQETKVEEWDQVINVNMRAPFFLVSALYDLLKENKGAVVNVSSVHAIATSKNILAYAASKGGLTTLTRSLAVECADDGVRVNAVLPGAVDTTMLRDGLKRGHVKGSSEDSLVRALGLKHLIGRVGQPEEIAEAIYYLADSSKSSFITGQCITIDGGATIKLSTE
ncbi:NAD(P)-dependent dehydrogenase (short-subunit alcohol dehydrogenase family) [Catalinimonas alkaloidigena]|uniref:SDR family NAD(P)-dependent oxidoreductase n=1 Tax=Catalinimonas alkaloidigena TaxID=1075417 RepID=UPI00240491E3|nr:SDR family oxidoreductase [Catalinimonas alkaloidigena]MDF9795210.1 NAD(P)-dependent dehydrogenase (short-subunit alcohol dehydrogenase family) [Catalinimonas alkaloidigena]